MKRATVLDEGPDEFALEYEDTLGRKNQMRLDAATYEGALREARSYLGIGLDDLDEAGDRWTVE
ncbi:MAG: hypothetical protein HYR88_05250 [Verrucomicrobia bacterium]|nr:hypothetical protein [Verrucomicrobiota bacterium]